MPRLDDLYTQRCRHSWSIDQHLPTLRRYAAECTHVTEFGTHVGFSTVAFLAARTAVVRCYDIARHEPDVTLLETLAAEEGLDFRFHQASSLEVTIEPTELLFIDSLHDYAQVAGELTLHGNRASKYLILHDTEERASSDETDVLGLRPAGEPPGPGIWPAVTEFLDANPHWTIREHFTHQYGLTVLERSVS